MNKRIFDLNICLLLQRGLPAKTNNFIIQIRITIKCKYDLANALNSVKCIRLLYLQKKMGELKGPKRPNALICVFSNYYGALVLLENIHVQCVNII